MRRRDARLPRRRPAESRAAAAGRMNDHAAYCATLGGGDLPLRGGRGDQHLARGGAGLTKKFLRARNGAAAAGRHVAPDPVAREIFVRRGKFGLDLAPVAFELFGDQHGSAVKLPCPISDLAMRMITVSSGWITIQAVISGASSARAVGGPNGISKPSASAPPTPATLARNRRRFGCGKTLTAIPQGSKQHRGSAFFSNGTLRDVAVAVSRLQITIRSRSIAASAAFAEAP